MILRVLLSVLFGLLFWIQVVAAEQDDPAECLLISDIHFNPFLHPSSFAALAKHPASEWARLLDSTLSDGASQYGSDSNYPLLKSGLAAASKAIPHMDDFRVIEAERIGLVVNKLVPSISPIFRNNPGFQVYQYGRASGAVRNQRVYTRLYSVSGPPGFDSHTLSTYSCAILHTTLEEFEKCQRANGIQTKTQGATGMQ